MNNKRLDLDTFKDVWVEFAYYQGDRIISNNRLIIDKYKYLTGITLTKKRISNILRNFPMDERESMFNARLGKEAKENATINKDDTIEELKSERVFNEDGSQKLLCYAKMSASQSKDQNYVMEANGYPVKDWTIVNLVVNEWGSLSNPDNQNYQIKLTVKPKVVSDINENDLENLFKKVSKPLKPIDYKRDVDSNKSYAFFLTDVHVGYGYFDTKGFKEMIEEARQDAMDNNVEHVYLYNLGDFLHADNADETTARGTQLKLENTNAYEMWDLAVELMRYAVERLSFVPMTFIWTQGNHSRLAEYSVMNALKLLYKESKHITFDVDERPQKANNIYETFIGAFHGDMPKKNYTNWSHFMYAELWGKCTRWEQYSGHFHAKDVFTIGGLEHNTLGTRKPTDDYERSLGYGNYKRILEAYVYIKDKGKKRAFYY